MAAAFVGVPARHDLVCAASTIRNFRWIGGPVRGMLSASICNCMRWKMAVYPGPWRIQKFEEEAYADAASREVVRWLREARGRNDLWWVVTSRGESGADWDVFCWLRPRDARGHLLPAPGSAPTGDCDEYYRCSASGSVGGTVVIAADGKTVVFAPGGRLIVPRLK
jgi:hypothetical protein